MSVPSVSFEFFPPKSEVGEGALFDAASRLSSLRPEFVSVTYGAGGSTREPTAFVMFTLLNPMCPKPRKEPRKKPRKKPRILFYRNVWSQ